MCKFCDSKENDYSAFPYFLYEYVCKKCYDNICIPSLKLYGKLESKSTVLLKSENEIVIYNNFESLKDALPTNVEYDFIPTVLNDLVAVYEKAEPEPEPNFWGINLYLFNRAVVHSKIYIMTKETYRNIFK